MEQSRRNPLSEARRINREGIKTGAGKKATECQLDLRSVFVESAPRLVKKKTKKTRVYSSVRGLTTFFFSFFLS